MSAVRWDNPHLIRFAIFCVVSDPKNYHTAYLWANNMAGHPSSGGTTLIHIPGAPVRQQVLSLPEYNINICLGLNMSAGQGFCGRPWAADRQGCWVCTRNKGGLYQDAFTGKLKKFGV
jgi:hypothetical protein